MLQTMKTKGTTPVHTELLSVHNSVAQNNSLAAFKKKHFSKSKDGALCIQYNEIEISFEVNIIY